MHKRCFIDQGAPANIQTHLGTRGCGFAQALLKRPELCTTFEEPSEETRVRLAARARPVICAAFHLESDIRFISFVYPRFFR